MSVVLKSSGGGQVTIQEPTTASNFTVTLAAQSGTLNAAGPAFSAARTGSNQSVTSGVYTKIQYNTEDFDTNSNYDNATNYRFTPTVAGYYLITANYVTGVGTNAYLDIYKNGVNYVEVGVAASGNGFGPSISAVIYMNGSTDYVEAYCFINGTTPSVFGGTPAVCRFTGCLLRGA